MSKKFLNSVTKKKISNTLNLKKDKLKEIGYILFISFVYIIITIVIAHIIDDFFVSIVERELKLKDKNNFRIFYEVVFQVLTCVFAIYLIRKIVKLIPIIFKWENYNDMGYIYEGEIVISFIFIGSQPKLLQKINYIVTRDYLTRDYLTRDYLTRDYLKKEMKK
jgi:hypothetical protein